MRARLGWIGGRVGAITALVALLFGMAPLLVGAQTTTPQTPLTRPEPKLGRASATQTVSVALPLVTDTAALDAFLARVSDSTSPDYHHYLTPAEFTARFVDGAGRGAVVAFLQNAGLTVHDPGTGVTVSAEGAAAQVERAFGVQLDTYQAANGRSFVAADRTPALPANVAARVRGVVGLDTPHPRTPRLVPADPATAAPRADGSRAVAPRAASGCSGATSIAANAFTPNQLATAYGFDALTGAGYHGEGQTVALFELADYHDDYVTTWKNCFGLATPVTRVPVDGGSGYFGEEEADLDIDIITGLAPKIAQLLVYVAPNTDAGVLDAYQRIATDNAASAVSTSWGLCEAQNTITSAESTIFAQMAAQGMTVFAASGDSGTNDCGNGTFAVDDPASQPYVSGVGGTRLTVNGANAYTGETVWNSGSNGGGGGLSAVWPQPTWQNGPGVASGYANGMRQVPDVSANADPGTGYVVFALGGWHVYGGTSAAAPLWAAGTALVNQRLAGAGVANIGFGNPVWYRLLGQGAGAYHDVTAGTNCVSPTPCAPNIYPATAGYDMASGVGSPNFAAITGGLSPPATITSFTPASGPTNGGTTVTLTGANFSPGVTVTFGGQLAGAITWVNSTTLTVATPQYSSGTAAVVVRNPGQAPVSATTAYTFIAPVPSPAPMPMATAGSVPNAAPVVAHSPATTVPSVTPLPQPARR